MHAGVGTSVYYPKAVPHMSYYREKYETPAGAFPNASRISDQSISFTVGPHVDERRHALHRGRAEGSHHEEFGMNIDLRANVLR